MISFVSVRILLFSLLEQADQLTGDERKLFAEKVRTFFRLRSDANERSIFI